jgi:RNA polymerase sigma factor (TIGR02999 family)
LCPKTAPKPPKAGSDARERLKRFSYHGKAMSEATRLINAIDEGDPHAARQLLPLVYDELRRLAAQRLSNELPGHTLQATALVHEAYLRLVDVEHMPHFEGRGHFFAAAAEAMRRVLIDSARRKKADKRGGDWQRLELLDTELAVDSTGEDLLAVDEALSRLEAQEPAIAKLVELRCFTGMTLKQSAEILNIPLRSASRDWAYARAWLRRELDRTTR